jgi:phosphoglycolate phosphatase-like HAD superfamily hydrolase
MAQEKILVFDMDGTLADFYSVNGWLQYLKEQNPTPYIIAEPLYDMEMLACVLGILRYKGWKVVITSWLAKDSTKEFDNEVRQAKRNWLAQYRFPYDEIHLVKYGTTKANCTRHLGGMQILVDDNDKVRKGWNLGATINANENIMEKLFDLLLAEF